VIASSNLRNGIRHEPRFSTAGRDRFVQSFRFSCSRPTLISGWPLCAEWLVVAIRLLPLYRKGVEVGTSTEVDGQPVLYSEVSGTIALLREHLEVVRRSEIRRVRGRLNNLSSDQEDVVESLSRSIIEKVLQAPVAMLLNAAAANQSAFIVKTVRRVFNLPT